MTDTKYHKLDDEWPTRQEILDGMNRFWQAERDKLNDAAYKNWLAFVESQHKKNKR